MQDPILISSRTSLPIRVSLARFESLKQAERWILGDVFAAKVRDNSLEYLGAFIGDTLLFRRIVYGGPRHGSIVLARTQDSYLDLYRIGKRRGKCVATLLSSPPRSAVDATTLRTEGELFGLIQAERSTTPKAGKPR